MQQNTSNDATVLSQGQETVFESPKRHQKGKAKRNDMQEFERTGFWGRISYLEIALALILTFCLIAGVCLSIFYGMANSNAVKIIPPNQTTVPETFYQDASEQYQALIAGIQKTNVSNRLLVNLPKSVGQLDAVENMDIYTQTAVWLLFLDPISVRAEYDLLPRFALATLFKGNNGENWAVNENWGTNVNVCTWAGVRCDRAFGKIVSLVLPDNNLTGEIPEIWELLPDLMDVDLSGNSLTGTIPGLSFGSLPELSTLNLKENELTGTIPVELKNSGSLRTMWLQHNNLGGKWPDEFCATPNETPFREFGVSCHKVACSCCVDVLNCFAD